MIKKTYIAPRIKALNLEPQSIVCGSGQDNESVGAGSGTAPTSAESNTRVGGSLWD